MHKLDWVGDIVWIIWGALWVQNFVVSIVHDCVHFFVVFLCLVTVFDALDGLSGHNGSSHLAACLPWVIAFLGFCVVVEATGAWVFESSVVVAHVESATVGRMWELNWMVHIFIFVLNCASWIHDNEIFVVFRAFVFFVDFFFSLSRSDDRSSDLAAGECGVFTAVQVLGPLLALWALDNVSFAH